MKKHIPNFLTCCNLLCGCLGIIVVLYTHGLYFMTIGCILVYVACVFDFFDGFVARLLKVSSPIGKELDSLADMVTFGLLPGVIIFRLLTSKVQTYTEGPWAEVFPYICFIGLIIPVFSALRLAKFNIDTRQSDRFVGVPTPANAILIASFPMIIEQNQFPFLISIITNVWFLVGVSIVMSFLLVAELPLFALKFKSFKWADNKLRFSFLIVSALLLIGLTWTAIPLIIFLYILLSVVANKLETAQVVN